MRFLLLTKPFSFVCATILCPLLLVACNNSSDDTTLPGEDRVFAAPGHNVDENGGIDTYAFAEDTSQQTVGTLSVIPGEASYSATLSADQGFAGISIRLFAPNKTPLDITNYGRLRIQLASSTDSTLEIKLQPVPPADDSTANYDETGCVPTYQYTAETSSILQDAFVDLVASNFTLRSDCDASKSVSFAQVRDRLYAIDVINTGTTTGAHDIKVGIITLLKTTTGNAAPVARIKSVAPATTGSTVNLDGSTSSDPNEDPLTYSWSFVSKPWSSSTSLLNGATATPSFVADTNGCYVVQLKVNDGTSRNNDSTNGSITTVTVVATKENSFATPCKDTNTAENATIEKYEFKSAPAEQTEGVLTVANGIATYSTTITGSNAETTAGTAIHLPAPGGVVKDISTYGALKIQLGSSTDTTLRIVLQPANPPHDSNDNANGCVPTYTYTATAHNLPSTPTIDLNASNFVLPSHCGKNEGDPSLTFAELNGQLLAIDVINPGSSVGTHDVKVGTIELIPPSGNVAPQADAGRDRSATTNSSVTLNGGFSHDANNDPLSYTWTFASKPTNSTATLTTPNEVNSGFIPDVGGCYVVQLQVSDGTNDSTAKTTLSVLGNSDNAFATPCNSTTTIENAEISTIAFVGAGGTQIPGVFNVAEGLATYGTTVVREPSVFAGTGLHFPAPNTVAKDISRFSELRIKFGPLTTRGELFQIALQPAISPRDSNGNANGCVPTASYFASRPLQTLEIPLDPYYFRLRDDCPTAEGDPSVLFAELENKLFAVDVVNFESSGFTDKLDVAVGTIELISPDGNVAPLAYAGRDRNATTGTAVNLSGALSHDVNDDPLTYAWTFTKKPAGSNALFSTPAEVNAAFTPNVGGCYIATLKVNDGIENGTADVGIAVKSANSFATTCNNVVTAESGKIIKYGYVDGSKGKQYELTLETHSGASTFSAIITGNPDFAGAAISVLAPGRNSDNNAVFDATNYTKVSLELKSTTDTKLTVKLSSPDTQADGCTASTNEAVKVDVSETLTTYTLALDDSTFPLPSYCNGTGTKISTFKNRVYAVDIINDNNSAGEHDVTVGRIIFEP